MIFSEQERKTLERIWTKLRDKPDVSVTIPAPAPDLRPLLNELGAALGRVEAKLASVEERLPTKLFAELASVGHAFEQFGERLGAIERDMAKQGAVDGRIDQRWADTMRVLDALHQKPKFVRNGAKGRGKNHINKGKK